MEVEILRPVEDDAEEIIERMIQAWEYAYERWEKGHYPKEAHDFDMSQNTPENYKRLMEDEHGFFFIAKVDRMVAGSIKGQLYGDSGFAILRNIAVHPDYHGNGIGRALMERMEQHLKERGVHKVSLHTLPVLIPAINLYMKMGFVPEAYLAKQWWGVDFILMCKWLNPGENQDYSQTLNF